MTKVIKCKSQPKYVGIEVKIIGFSGNYYWTYSKDYGTLWFYPFELLIK